MGVPGSPVAQVSVMQDPQRSQPTTIIPTQLRNQIISPTRIQAAISRVRATPAPSWTVLTPETIMPPTPEPVVPSTPILGRNFEQQSPFRTSSSAQSQDETPQVMPSPQTPRSEPGSASILVPSKRLPSPPRAVKTEMDPESEPDMPSSKRARIADMRNSSPGVAAGAFTSQPRVVSSPLRTDAPVRLMASPVTPEALAPSASTGLSCEINDSGMQMDPPSITLISGPTTIGPATNAETPEATVRGDTIERPGSSMSISTMAEPSALDSPKKLVALQGILASEAEISS